MDRPRIDPLEYLRRADKWYLGGGKGAMYAPEFPKWLNAPGFWDECYYADLRLERLFHIFVCDEDGRPLEWVCHGHDWRPDRLVTRRTCGDLEMTETRVVTENHSFCSALSLFSPIARKLHILAWSLQEKKRPNEEPYTSINHVSVGDQYICFAHHAHHHRDIDLYVSLAGSAPRNSYTINLAEPCDPAPYWQTSIFIEKWKSCLLPNDEKWDAGWNPTGQVHIAQHYSLEVQPNEPCRFTFAAAINTTREKARPAARDVVSQDVAAQSERAWREYFDSVPYFDCSDEHITRYYWYRWYGLRLLTVDVQHPPFPCPCVFEGIGAFREHISYSAQCHIRETSWMHDSSLAEGCLLGELACQHENGFIPGHIYSVRDRPGFYHADWGRNAMDLYAITGRKEFLEQIYHPLSKYAAYFERGRDMGGIGLYDVLNQGETGQEYMSRYLFVDDKADEWGRICLKGVDATLYIYELFKALAAIAPDENWQQKAERTKRAVREYMWDPVLEMFCDVDPKTLRRSPFKSALCFYPFSSDLAASEHIVSIQKHLLNPDEFWTPYPVPAASVDDPYFNAQAEWKGKRTNCPWNGRVWPMTNSHIAEALVGAARHDATLRRPAADFIRKFIHMMFYDGDPKKPNCFEHYNPFTGQACEYRGVDDYQHSWVVDLIIRHVAGLQPQTDGGLSIDPLPFDLDWVRLENARIRGQRIDVQIEGSEWCVYADGHPTAIQSGTIRGDS